jgi:hypothetical protein
VQPLRENAGYHGIQPAQQGGVVRLAVSAAGGRLRIEVSNPLPPPGAATTGSGMALANIRSRLAAIYGDAAELSAAPDGAVYKAVLSVPAQAGESDLAEGADIEHPALPGHIAERVRTGIAEGLSILAACNHRVDTYVLPIQGSAEVPPACQSVSWRELGLVHDHRQIQIRACVKAGPEYGAKQPHGRFWPVPAQLRGDGFGHHQQLLAATLQRLSFPGPELAPVLSLSRRQGHALNLAALFQQQPDAG